MKYGFSTLGCPAWSFDEILSRAKAYGFSGFEVRGIQGEMDLLKIPEFQPAAQAETLRKTADHGLEMMMLMTGCRFSSDDPAVRRANIDDAKANLDLAAAMNIDKIRVFGGVIPDGVTRDEAHAWIADSLREVCEHGQSVGVNPTIEAHDDFSDTHIVRDMLNLVGHPFLMVQWDIHHPFRKHGEAPATGWANIGERVVDTHFKDSFINPERKQGYEYCLMGEGDIPNRDALKLLIDGGYDGYLTLEWEKAWQDYLPEPTVGFPQYVEKMNTYLEELGAPIEVHA